MHQESSEGKMDTKNSGLFLVHHLILGIFATIPFLRYGISGIIRPLDSYFPMLPLEYFNRLSAWYETGAYFGNDGSFTSIAFKPFYFLPAILDSIGLPVGLVNRLTYILIFFSLGAAAYYMVNNLLPTKNSNAPLISALFYMYNPFITGYLNLGHWYTLISYAVLPVMLTFLDKSMKADQWEKYAISMGFLSIFIIPRVRILPEIIQVLFYYIVIYFVKSTNRNKENIQQITRVLGVIIISSILFNIFWILPTLGNIDTVFNLLTTPPIVSETQFHVPSSYRIPWNILFLVGYGIPMNEYGLHYLNPGIIYIFSILLIFIGLNIRFKKKTNYTKYFLLIGAIRLVFIFLVTFIPEFVELYLIAEKNTATPFNLLLFPTSLQYTSLPILLSYTYLLGNIINEIPTKLKYPRAINQTIKVTPIIIVIVILLISKPTLVGVDNDFLEPIQIPDYYYESRNWLQDQENNFRILVVPHSEWLLFVKHQWAFSGIYDISEIIEQITPTNVLVHKPDFGYSAGANITESAYDSLQTSDESILDLLNIKYILVRNDVISSQTIPVEEIREKYQFERQFGELEYYINPNYTPIISVSQRVIPVYGSVKTIENILRDPKVNGNPTSIILMNQNSFENQKTILERERFLLSESEYTFSSEIEKYIEENEIKIVQIENGTILDDFNIEVKEKIEVIINKLSQERYEISLNSTYPIYLNFNEIYNPKWIATSNNAQLSHYISNSFANCWYLEPEGSNTIKIEYVVWKNAYWGEKISLGVTTVFVIYLIVEKKTRKPTEFIKFKKIFHITRRLFDPINKYGFRNSEQFGLLAALSNPIGIDRWIRYNNISKELFREPSNIILDVGPGSEGISAYYNKQKFILLDINQYSFEKIREGGVLADGNHLPFKNNAFKTVSCLDTLEHIPKKDRPKIVSELKRVTREKLVLSTVLESKDGEFQGKTYDEKFLEAFQSRFGFKEENTWEHIKNGHPTKDEITNYFPNTKIIGYQNVENWLKYMTMQYRFPFGLLTGLYYYLFWSNEEKSHPYWGAIVSWKKERIPLKTK
jgi:ubiquinone/menaquinone biosynthesis C-methylase UbiE